MKYTPIIKSLVLLFGTLTSCQHEAVQKKPNVVVILVDDMGWTDLACFGSDYYQTPNIDQLAKNGIRFTNSYSACTVCSPTRASVMTGKYPARLHLTDWIEGHKNPWAKLKVPEWKMYLDSSEFTLAEAFKQDGYFTAHIGKWHLGEEEKDWPENHGFQINIGGWAKGSPNRDQAKGFDGYFSPYGNPRLSDGEEGEYLTERLAKEVCDIIDQKAGEPFFINFWLYNVHMPLQARQDKIEKYKALQDSSKHHHNPVYAAMVEHTDDAVGKIVAKLKEKGLDENTIILFSSDNGGLIGNPQNQVTSNFPLRRGKGGMYEGGVRVPTILFVPNQKFKVKEITEPVISIDFYPSLLELAGIPMPESQKVNMDGMSWVPLLKGENSLNRDAIYWHYPHYHKQGAVPYSAMRSGDWKLVNNLESGELGLYNLANDIGESINLAHENPEKVMELKKKLDTWRESVDAQFPSLNENYDKDRAW
jgi:arylsulfatase A-like enzyme